ncbi:CerR family C-terminal domain-containing protein [Ramlibacter tataouinensis]|uniref:Transcriptional regulator, TetR family-like protein n=1 Tax=Ramlibacter tataouinensis (strain ATCC BAA-407 / DSM 14655 / LMG 21543 / TTB310) TaxID=365046 RepID=F5Y256_RAMTT|nr:CerR family C-terminal domain-containing protein [Ramlibacter tataouinensis]AEG94824.1 transcriptional regulator, TetR family-like protein [Ramlibacter tataouinensis TTB310]
MAALKLFAEKGFAKTSTREIAQAAGANVAAIRYYFGDKAGLYRAAFVEPMGSPRDDIPLYDQPQLPLRQSLEIFMRCFLEPMKQGELVQHCTRLHFREMLEPTSVWQEEIENGIRPAHAALARILCRHLGLAQADDEVHRLGFAIVALPIHLYICRDIIDAISPRLLADEAAIDRSVQRLAELAMALVEAEAVRRRAAPAQPAETAR